MIPVAPSTARGPRGRWARPTHCPRGHDLAVHGVVRKNGRRMCRTCNQAKQQIRNARRPRTALVRLQPGDRTHCPKGHAYDADNTRWVRRCRACDRAGSKAQRLRRPLWATIAGGGRVSITAHDQFSRARWAALREALRSAHPDRGGTARKFQEAHRAYRAFVADEKAWYARCNLAPPFAR